MERYMEREGVIDELRRQVQPVSPDDAMTEAGRKVLLAEFIEMLKHEQGSRTGADIEDVHDMRVATRRMRSILRLLGDHFKTKVIRAYDIQLRKIARALGAVRDLDVQIDGLTKFQATLDEERAAALGTVIRHLDDERTLYRLDLNRTFDKGQYQRFVEDFGAFLTTPGAGARQSDPDEVHPVRVRHLLPTLIYSHLGSVRAYERVLDGADDTTLHALRIEFKRLRYAVSMFADLLDPTVRKFIDELKLIQDHLGRINDIHVAQTTLGALADDLDDAPRDVLAQYIAGLEQEAQTLRSQVGDVWRRFGSKVVQRQLATAVAAL